MSTERRDELMAQAKELGVKVHHMAGEQKIQDAIDAHLAKNAEADLIEKDFGAPVNKNQIDPETGKIVPLTSEEFRRSVLPERKKIFNRLVRCRVTCMNPAKKAWEGEIISVGSAKNGTFKKFIPFDGREYHIPNVIYEELKNREYSVFSTVRNERGQEIKKARLVKEFAIDVLPPLTPKELEKLRKEQALANNQG
jgi:hypothetical protein